MRWFALRNTFSAVLVINAVLVPVVCWLSVDFCADIVEVFRMTFAGYDVGWLISYLEVLGACFAVEMWFLGWKRCSVRKLLTFSRSARTDLVIAGSYVLQFGTLLTTFATFGSSWWVWMGVRRQLGFDAIQAIDNHLLQFLVWFVVLDFLDYWHHRALHSVRFLWEAHRYHHSATEFTMLTGNRIHHLEAASMLVFTAIPMAILGSPVEAYLAARVIRQTVDLFQHSMVEWRYGWIGNWLIYSPVGHRIHHSADEEHWERNYGNIMPLWDRLFGTWYDGDKLNADVDMSDNPFNTRGVWHEYAYCYRRFFSVLWDSLRTGRWLTWWSREAHAGDDESVEAAPVVPLDAVDAVDGDENERRAA